MSISSDQNRVGYSGNGSSAVFNYPYEFHNDSELAVLVYNSSRAPIVGVPALNTNYSISGSKDLQGRYLNGANVVFNSTPATGDEIVIFGSTPVNSVYALGFNEHISRPDLVKSLDHLVLINQRLNNQVTRALRLPDAYPYNFDTRLPARILPSSVLATNSSGLGIELLFAVGSSGLVPSGGIDVPLIGQGFGVPPIFSPLNLASNSSIINNLVVSRGGTGHSSFITASMVYASSADTLSFVAVGGGDVPLVGNPGGAPSFRALDLISGSSTINILPVVKGGTNHSSFVSASVVYASSLNTLSFIANPVGADVPLVSNLGGAPSYQPLNLASNSSVTNILSTSRGGTGNSGYVQYGVVYMETATKMAHIPSAAAGRVLVSNGSSAPTFNVLSITPTAALAKSANYTATTSDDVIVCDGSTAGITINLFDAVGNSGRRLSVKKIDASAGVVTIDGSGSQTIDAAATLRLCSRHDSVGLVSDGANWVTEAMDIAVACVRKGQPAGAISGTPSVCSFPTNVNDTHGGWVGSSYTVPLAGHYDIHARVGINGTYGADGSSFCGIFIDGVQAYDGEAAANNTITQLYPSANVCGLFLAANAVITIRPHSDAGSPSYNSTAERSWFSISRR